MKPYYEDEAVTIYHADFYAVMLETLPRPDSPCRRTVGAHLLCSNGRTRHL